jgi:NAD(P)-dependent dehydrogenase (short-subunit alcohol dehydrogenase family)
VTSLRDLLWTERSWNGTQAYCDSKLHDVLLAFAVSRRWKDTLSNSLEPGWVATKMGGPNAPDDLSLAPKTQAWLAASDDVEAKVTGSYFYHRKPREAHPMARSAKVQDDFIAACEYLSGVQLPA